MLNENKIKMMTKMAIYEKNDGKKMIRTAKYFKGDYVSLEVLKTLITTTIAYIIMIALYALCNMDSLIADLNNLDYVSLGRTLAIYYVLLLIVFGVISAIVYSNRYENTRKDLKKYFSRLNKLERFYNGQKKIK